jgi:hypothetical protein
LAKKDKKGSSEFSKFFREASSGTRKKVFKEAARKASEDQRKIFYSDGGKVKTV